MLKRSHQCKQTSHLNDLNNINNYIDTDKINSQLERAEIQKRLSELVLLSQPYIKDSSLSVEDLVKQAAAKIGENIKVRRFTRYTLGEGIEKNQMDFAEEVASMQTN